MHPTPQDGVLVTNRARSWGGGAARLGDQRRIKPDDHALRKAWWWGYGSARSGDQRRSRFYHHAAESNEVLPRNQRDRPALRPVAALDGRLLALLAAAALSLTTPQTAQAADGVLPEVVIAVDASESMHLSIAKGGTTDCSSKKPLPTRWTAVQQMLMGTIPDYRCTQDSLPSHSDTTTPPKQLMGSKTCIGGVPHVIATKHKPPEDASMTKPVGVKSWSGAVISSGDYLRLLATSADAAAPFFSYDVGSVPTTEGWVSGALNVVTKYKNAATSGDVWAFLVKLDKNPAGQNGKVFMCDALTKSKSNVVSAPVKLANSPGGVTSFSLTEAYLKTMHAAAKAGQKQFFFAIVTQKTWFKTDCTGRGDDLAEQVDMQFFGPTSSWTNMRPHLAINVGKHCDREGPGVSYSAVGSHGSDGALAKYANAAKFSLLVPDTAMDAQTSGAGGHSFGKAFGSYWGDINLGAADPFASGSNSVPMPRKDTSSERLGAIKQIRGNLSAMKPVGGTPLAAMIEDIAAYFGPDAAQDKHFQSQSSDAKNGDPYYECRTRMAMLFTDGGANLHTGASDGRAAAVQAAALLWTRGVALYVVVPGADGVDKADLAFADELAAAGGTGAAWRVDTAAELNKSLKVVLQTVGTTGETLTPTVLTTSTGNEQDVQHTFHAMSQFDVTEPMQSWGVLEQRIFGCETGCVDVKTPGRAQVCSVIDYGWRLANRTAERRLYTQFTGARSNLTAAEVSHHELKIDASEGLAPKLALDASNNCVTKPNTFDLGRLKERKAYAADVLAQVWAAKGSCRENRPLGAVGFARPVVLGPADQIPLRDPSFRAFASRSAPSSASYSTSVRPGGVDRPTMLFASTHEGVLHAFRTDRNPKITTQDNLSAGDELWAWMPLFNLRRIRSLKLIADAERSFLGGGIAAAHVQLNRFGNSVSELSDRWRSVVVAGAGEAGVGYFALDVTSPEDPRLLWDIAPGHHCFGSGTVGAAKGPKCLMVKTYNGLGRSTAAPVLATAHVTFQGVTTQRAIAVIAGGKPPLESSISNIGTDGTGKRAIWIIDMATGALIRKLTSKDIDLTGSTVTVTKKKTLGYFYSAPTCYDAAPGQLVSRCFIGDSKGMLWRVDLSDANPSRWKISFFHDAYSSPDTPASLVQGITGSGRVPVLTPPVVSTDKDGALVVVYGTGGPKDAAKFGRRHIVYSVKEKLTLGANGVAAKIEAEGLWMNVMSESSRYIGPPTIFSRNAYFASYTISANGVCASGTARMWGAHYTQIATASDSESIIGAFPAPTTDGSAPTLSGKKLTNLIIGNQSPSPIEIVPVPACVAGCAPTDFACLIKAKKSAGSVGKPLFEANVSVTSKTQGTYQKPSSGAQPKVGTVTRNLSTPRSTTVITGWDLLLD